MNKIKVKQSFYFSRLNKICIHIVNKKQLNIKYIHIYILGFLRACAGFFLNQAFKKKKKYAKYTLFTIPQFI